MTTKKLLTAVSLLCLSLAIGFAQGPNGSNTYYQNADGKSGAALKTALHGIIKDPSVKGYEDLTDYYSQTDKRADGKVRDRYSNITNYAFSQCTGNYSKEGDMYNKEHSFPKSWFGGKVYPMYSDLFHVIPADGYVNNRRGNVPFGTTNGNVYVSANNYSKVGNCTYSGYTGTVFEPDNEWKGDFARIYFYMVTCYEDKVANWIDNATSTDKSVAAVLNGTKYPAFTDWQKSLLLEWSRNDPVSEIEIARNSAVYNIQGNRNPFVDYPGLEEYIWGTKTSESFDYTMGGSGVTPTTVFTPTFSLAGGAYTTAQTVTISCATSGATIYYTTNGSKPSTSSTMYNGAITISETTTLKAIAIKDGTESSVAEATYTINTGGGDEPTPSGETLLWESFSKGSNISESGISLNTSNLSSYCDYTGWSTLANIYADPGNCGRVGSSKNQGSLVANNIVLTGDAILTYKIKNYNKDSGKTVNVSISGASATGDLTATGSSEWVEHTVNITGATGSISLSFSGGRIAIDDIKLVAAGQTPATLLGDVNNDGEVTIADVTALVNILLCKDTSYNLDAADVNSDDKTTIADVTELVNILLKK